MSEVSNLAGPTRAGIGFPAVSRRDSAIGRGGRRSWVLRRRARLPGSSGGPAAPCSGSPVGGLRLAGRPPDQIRFHGRCLDDRHGERGLRTAAERPAVSGGPLGGRGLHACERCCPERRRVTPACSIAYELAAPPAPPAKRTGLSAVIDVTEQSLRWGPAGGWTGPSQRPGPPGGSARAPGPPALRYPPPTSPSAARRMSDRRCPVCGEDLSDRRSDARTCAPPTSTTCPRTSSPHWPPR
jgi:hypothetical protein